MYSVPRPRWLCVATGTALEDALDLVVAEAVVESRSRAAAPTSPCAHGQAVIPCAVTPTTRLVPRSVATAIPCSV